MASRAPPIPPAQRSHAAEQSNRKGGRPERRDAVTGLQDHPPADSASSRPQARPGGAHPTTHRQAHQQDR